MGKKVIKLWDVAPDAALLGLNRLTGLDFSTWPESLINSGTGRFSREMEEYVAAVSERQEKRQA